MSKIGMTSGTVIALSVLATVFSYQPSHASDALLAKAQAEFTAKARDAVLQRRAAQIPAGMVLASTQSEPVQTQKLASLEQPAAPSAPASADRSIPERTGTAPVQAATTDVVEAPVVVAKLPDADATVIAETKVEEAKPLPESNPLPVEHIEAPKQPELPQAAAPQVVTPAPQVATPAPQVATPAPQVATPVTTAPAAAKTQKATREPAKTASAKNPNLRQIQREFAAGRMPYDAETLRAKAPEIAAAIARYM
jgi:hypothetical protein